MMGNEPWVQDNEEYYQTEGRDLSQIRRVLILTMLLNFLASGLKMGAGLITGALSVIADGLDSLFDGISNVAGLAGLWVAAKPPDVEHPYGHRKFETLAALSISVFLFITCYQLLVSAWERLGSHFVPEINWWVIGAMFVSMGVQAATSIYELRQGRKLKSEILVADAMHTRASILISISVLCGLALVRLGLPVADPILAVLVALVIGKIGIDVLRETLPILVDRAPIAPQEIAKVVDQVGGIESFHRVRSRGPIGNAAVDLHIRVSPEKTVQEANAISDEVRRRLLALDSISDVTVHVEPQRGLLSDASDLFATLKHAAGEIGLTVHEVFAYRTDEGLYTEMHVGVEPRLTLGEAHTLVDRLEEEIHARVPELKGIHTHIELASKSVQIEDLPTSELEDEVLKAARQAVAQFPGLSNPHNLRIHRDPGAEGEIFISLDCSIAAETPITQAHHMASLLEEEISHKLEKVGDVSVHLEPPGAKDLDEVSNKQDKKSPVK
jgi:cation diffusion facilitator family transporter